MRSDNTENRHEKKAKGKKELQEFEKKRIRLDGVMFSTYVRHIQMNTVDLTLTKSAKHNKNSHFVHTLIY